ncbi:hypothetical protein M407DRAFT_34135 [Tulasnella calospora MUT 4182]|uniref:ABC transmembrane type-1 domain-containing protein n=1 Tax=Tulasnella calospora MUT 4182 TaxID=1051891 RepID=A0A0C3Q1T1_9AGAM|nr:hypothetical protein M407DRAFT_34135 [Tulasnella calospora MUT 4182]
MPDHLEYSWFIRFVCLFLLWDEPAVTLRLLDDVWPGGAIYLKPWREMMDAFSNEWEKIFLLSAVTFAGAMAFLAIPAQALQGNSDPQDPSLVASFAICCGIACCAFSVASLITASNLKRDFRGNIAVDVHEASDYLQSLYSNKLGYLKWGICLSLPRVLFQWALVSFCAGLVILAFQLHQTQIWFFYTEISMAIVLAVAVVFGRYLSPDRITPDSILRRAISTARDILAGATLRASTLFTEKKEYLVRSKQIVKSVAAFKRTAAFPTRYK